MASTGPEKICVRAPNWIGDHVMALPFYLAIRKAYPKARLVLLGAPAVLGLPFPEIFEETITLDRKGTWRVGRLLRGQNFDLAVTLPASISSALTLFFAGIPRRVGYSADGADLFLTASLPWPGRHGRRHKSRLYLELAEFLTGERFSSPAASRVSRVREKLLIVAPGASLPLREWPGYLELLRDLRRTYPEYRLLVVGTETKWHSQIRRLEDPSIEDNIGKTSLGDLVYLMAKASVVVANDSGPAHLAALAGAPVVVIFGPGDPRYARPLGSAVEIVRRQDLSCSPCEKAYCARPFGYQACLRGIDVQTVMAKIDHLLLVSGA